MDLDREEELVDGPSSWSVSKLQTIQTCGNKYKLRYVDHVKEEKTVALKFGSVVHQLIDQIHKGRFESIGDLQEAWIDTWGPIARGLDWSQELMTPRIYKGRGLTMLEKYWNVHRDDVVVASEVRFETPASEHTPALRGIIDKVQEIAPGVLGIVDFKTSKHPPDWTVLRRDLQLTTYYLAGCTHLGYCASFVAIHHLLSGEVYWTWRDENDIVDLQAALNEAKAKVNHKMYARNIDFHCKFCPYKEVCLSVD